MLTKVRYKTLAAAGLLLWLGIMFAPLLMAQEAWHRVEHRSLDFLFTNLASSGTAYQEVYLDPVSVWYPNAKIGGSEKAEALQRSVSERFQAAFAARGLNVVTEPTQSALVVHVELIDLKAAPVTAELLDWAKGHRFKVQPGRVTLVAELRDAATGQVLIRMADLEEDAADAPESEIDIALDQWGDVIAASIIAHVNGTQLASVQR